MNKTEQGVLYQSKLLYSLIHLLLLLTFFLPQAICADVNTENKIQNNNTQTLAITLIYSADSALQKEIAKNISTSITSSQTNIDISEKISLDHGLIDKYEPDLVIAIGLNNMLNANKHYAKINKLFIVSDPGEYKPAIDTNSQESVLYMTQSYCRQLQFIKLINQQWKTFSYLSNKNKPVDDAAIRDCANKYDISAFKVTMTDNGKLTNDIKNALDHSELILALPDKEIYNRKTVKNILLTSYRHRKPVIAFSKKFVNAGALASIHSNTEQISKSAITLVEQYLANNYKFNNAVNHPKSFDISINRQVFKALNIDLPDTKKIKNIIESSDTDKKK